MNGVFTSRDSLEVLVEGRLGDNLVAVGQPEQPAIVRIQQNTLISALEILPILTKLPAIVVADPLPF